MASRLAVSSLKAAARPRAVAALPQALHARPMSTNKPPPEKRAEEIINNLPSKPSLVTKTGTALLGTGLAAAAISQELYVVNEESILLAGTIILFTFLAKSMREPFGNWAQGAADRVANVLNEARAEHTNAVKERLNAVAQMKDVVSLTEGLFALSKETANLEAETFVQKQKVALAADVKAVLDSWVRFEQQQKESEQADLTKTVIERVLATLQDEKTQKDILTSAIAEVEQLVKAKAI
ncbi:hypothetical protein EV122DRAFT_266346 [Schizophyllum commune]